MSSSVGQGQPTALPGHLDQNLESFVLDSAVYVLFLRVATINVHRVAGSSDSEDQV
jgi:hypothetical protein